MGLSNVTYASTPTSYSVTGGTNVPLSLVYNDGKTVRLAPTADTDLRLRRVIEISRAEPRPAVDAPNGLTQERFNVWIKDPKLLANGKIATSSVKLQLQYEVECTPQEKLDLCDIVAQLMINSSFRTAVSSSNVVP